MQLVTESAYGVTNRAAFFGDELTTSGAAGLKRTTVTSRRPLNGLNWIGEDRFDLMALRKYFVYDSACKHRKLR